MTASDTTAIARPAGRLQWFTALLAAALIAAVVLAAGPRLALAAPAVSLPAGLFALTPARRPVDPALLADPRLAGIVVRGFWQDVEAREGEFRWEALDAELDRVAAAGKQASLVVINGGVNTPAWVVDGGAATVQFTDRNRFHKETTGKAVTIPLFWDQRLLAAKKRLIAEMGRHFAGRPGLRLVSAQCANATTDDWNVPAGADNVAAWQRAGFRPETLLDACRDIVDATMAAFPGQFVRMAIGRVAKPLDADPDGVAAEIVRHARARYGDRFIVMRHNLSARTPDPRSGAPKGGWQVLAAARPAVAGQMLWPAVDTRSCRMNGGRSPCDPATMLAAAAGIGRAYGMSFLEIYGSDLVNDALQPVVDRLAPATPAGAAPAGEAGGGEIRRTEGPPPRPEARGEGRPPREGMRPARPGAGPGPGAGAGSRGAITERRWVNPPAQPGRGVEHQTFRSAAAGTEVGYSIALPPGYASGDRRYPVLYWLHGKGGDESRGVWLSAYLRAAEQRGDIAETILVFVNGLPDSFYTDSADGRYPVETVIIQELIPHIDAHYRTQAERKGRAIEGFSMGGFGALKFAARHPALFQSVNIFGAALFDQPARRDSGTFETVFGGDLAAFESNLPHTWLRRHRQEILDRRLAIRIVAGAEDMTRKSNEAMHRLLSELAVPHDYLVLDGVRHAPRTYYDQDEGRSFRFHAAARGEAGR